jgi:3-hydroxyisobutyrate dehydrogenase
MARIGFIGLGNMGGPMVTMLPAGRHVKAVYLGEEGVLAHAAGGTLLIDSSTIDVATAREVATAASGAGMVMVDAPVSGGVGGAAAGTLTFMVGGPDEAFAAASPLLEAMGKTIVHAGGPGNGQAAKICNNMILGISMIGVCEAFVLAEKLGLDHQKLFDISSTASGQCWSLTTYCPVPGPVPTSPANRDYKAGFTAGMMLKDLRLAQDAAQSVGAATPLRRRAGYRRLGNQNKDKNQALKPRYLEGLNLIERLHRRLLDVIKDEFERHGEPEVNSVQALLLFNIGDCELTAGELKTRGHYQGSNVSYNLKKLVDAGYVNHERSNADRRSVRVRLTPRGQEIRQKVDELFNRQLHSLQEVAGLSTEEFDRLNRALARLERYWTDQILYRL